MSDSTSNLDLLYTGAANLPTRINELLDAISQGMFGRRASTTTGLTWGFYKGVPLVNGAPDTSLVNDTVALNDNATNYIECDPYGVVVNAGATRTPGNVPLYAVTTVSGVVTSYLDERNIAAFARVAYSTASQAMGDANKTMTQDQALSQSVETTGALTAQRDLVVPSYPRGWIIRNACTGFGVQVIAATGTGIVIGATKVAMVEFDGTNVRRVTADSSF